MKKEPFALTVMRYLGKPYKLGGTGEDGFGCIDFVYNFLKDRGCENLKTEVEGISLENYAELIGSLTDAEIEEKLIQAFELNGVRIEGSPMVGDCLVLENKAGTPFPAIYAGSRTVITSFLNEGVRVYPIGYFNVVGIWRVK